MTQLQKPLPGSIEATLDLLGAADQMKIAPNSPMQPPLVAPRLGVALALMLGETLDGHRIGGRLDGVAVGDGLALGIAAKHHRVDDSAKLPTALFAGGLDHCVVDRQRVKRGVDLMAGWAGDEDQIRMPGSILDPGW